MMPKFDFMWVELNSLDGFYSHTPGETPVIALGQHIRESSADYWRVFLGLLAVHYNLTAKERLLPYMAFSPRIRSFEVVYEEA